MKSFFIWDKAPALLYGLAYLCGIYFALGHPLSLFFLPFLLYTKKERFASLFFLFLLPLPLLQNGYIKKEEGIFKPSSISHHHAWIYKGKMERVPCTLVAKSALKPKARFRVKGVWEDNFFKAEQILPLEGGLPLAKWRYDAKRAIENWISTHFRYERSAQFLSALITGELHNPEMKKEFSQLGLSHLLAISGFHFSLLVFMLHLFLQKILPPKLEIIITLLLMSLYALFIGATPSAFRAWIFMTIYLGGQFFEKKSSALNTLGASLWIILLVDPYSALTISFQLTFVATAALLLFTPTLDQLLQKLFPKSALYEACCNSYLWQLGYLTVAMLRELTALTLAVNLTLLPLLLYHFHVFYPISLLFNLFFPFLTAIALMLLPLYPIADLYTNAILHLTTHSFGGIYVEQMPLSLTVALLMFLAIGGIILKERQIRRSFTYG